MAPRDNNFAHTRECEVRTEKSSNKRRSKGIKKKAEDRVIIVPLNVILRSSTYSFE